MAAPYPLLDLDCADLPADVAAEVPLPMLGVDPTTKDLTPRVAYVFTRIDGITSLGELLPAIPLSSKALLEALLLLFGEGLIGFSPEFEAQYLKPRPPVRTSVAPPSPSAPPPAVADAITFTPTRLTPARVTQAPAMPGATGEPGLQAPLGTPGAGTPRAGGGATFTIAPPGPGTPQATPTKLPPAQPLTIDRRGDLGVRPLARLARHASEARWTGVIALQRGKALKRVVFVGGEPTYVESDAPDEELGVLMHKRGKLDDRRFADYQALRKAGKQPVTALVEMGAMMPPDVPRADRWRAQAVLFDALLWRDGSYELGEPGALPPGAPRYDLGLPTLVVKAWREAPFDDQRKKFFDAHRNWYLVPSAVSADTVARMKLNPKEERLFASVQEQTRRIRDIFELTSLFITETYRFIDGLLAMGMAELTEKNPTEAGPVDVKELPALLQAMEAGNFFDRLSAHPISTDQDVVAARDRMLARFSPQYYSNLLPKTREILTRMTAMIQEAFEQLKDARQRKEYRAKQYDRARLEYFSDIQFRKGEIFLFWRDDPRTAFEIFESSWEMCPDIPLYASSYALASIRSFPGDRKRTTEARSILDGLLKRQDLHPKVLVIAAAAVRALGDIGRSEQLCRQALQASGNSAEITSLVEQVRKPEK